MAIPGRATDLPDTKRFGIAGEFAPPGFTLTSSLPWSRANLSLFYDGPADTWMQGLDTGAVVHYRLANTKTTMSV